MSYYDVIIERYTPIDEDEDEMWTRFEHQAGCYSYDEAGCYSGDEDD